MSSRSLKFIFRLVLHQILFLLYWLRIRSSLSFWPGILLFAVLSFSMQFFLYRNSRKFPASVLPVPAGLLVFPLLRILALPTEILPFPWDSVTVIFLSYYSIVFPAALLLFLFSLPAGRFHWFSFTEFSLYIGLFALLLGKKGWTLENPFHGHMVFAFLFLGVGGLLSLFIFLTFRSRKTMTFWKEFLPILLFSGLLLIPAGRLYRAESLKEGGGLLESSLFNFDFAPFLTLESKISMKDELVFLLQKEGPSEELYLRRFILGAYSPEKGFYSDLDESYETPRRKVPDYRIQEGSVRWDVPEYKERERVYQTFYYVNFDGSAFLGMNIPESMVPYFSWEDSSFSRIYRVGSLVSRVGPWELIDGDLNDREENPDEDFYNYYTEYGNQEDLRLLALEISGDLPGTYLKASAIRDYFQDEYLYSLNPGTSPEGDQLRYFLFEGKKGYCSYFAFSMTLLCRSLGIPSRVVLGFWVDTQSGVLNFYPVNANQAHAWVEVYFPEYGWIEFDPTSKTLAPGESFEFTSYNPEELEPYIREILANQESLSEIVSSPGQRQKSLLFRINRTWDAVKNNPGRILVFTLIFLFLARVASLVSLLYAGEGKRKRIVSAYRHHKYLVLSGFLSEDSAGPLSAGELAEYCREKGFISFYEYTSSYKALLFSSDPPDSGEWFRFSRKVRKDFFSLVGGRTCFLSFMKLILFYREIKNAR